MKEKVYTYKDFLRVIGDTPGHLKDDNVESLLRRFKLQRPAQASYAPATYLLDYTTQKYLYIENTCLDVTGYTAAYFLERGLQEYTGRWHPTDAEVLNSRVFLDNFSFVKQLRLEDYHKYVISYNYRFRNPNDEYINLLQRFSYLPGEGLPGPAGVVGVVFNITHFKSDNSIVHTIERVEEVAGETSSQLIFKKIHPLLDHLKPLSKREKEILSLMAKGLSSKQIAALTSLSINTVNNHRKNMLSRTNSRSSTELMNYALKHGLV